MYFTFRNKHLEDLPEENTQIWSCTKEGCKGWMRDNFAFDVKPDCCLCPSPMVSDTKMLPLLVNSNDDPKAVKRGVPIKPVTYTIVDLFGQPD